MAQARQIKPSPKRSHSLLELDPYFEADERDI
jgi:hypothetical protein